MTTSSPAADAAGTSSGVLAAIRRQWALILVLALIGAVIAWFSASAQATTYESTATVVLVAAGDEVAPDDGDGGTLDVDTWATMARSTALLQQVANDLELELDDVRDRTSASAASEGDVLRLTFEAASEQDAADGAAMYSELFLTNRQQSVNAGIRERIETLRSLAVQLDGEIADRDQEIADVDAQGEDASGGRLAVLVATQQAAIARQAEVEDELGTLDADAATGSVVIDPQSDVAETGIGPTALTILGLLLGGLVGLVIAALRGRADDRYGRGGDAARLGLREVGRVP